MTATALALALLVCAPAGAQESDDTGMQVDLGTATTDRQGTHLAVPVTCTAPAAGQSACPVFAAVSSQRTAVGKWAPDGPVTQLAQTTATIPAGATQTLAVDVPVKLLRNPLAKAHGAAIASFTLFDGSGSEVGGTGVYVDLSSVSSGCGGAKFPRVTSGKLLEDERIGYAGSKPQWAPLHAPGIIAGTEYKVTGGTASVTFNGVRWTLARGSRFTYTCTGLTDYFHRRMFPTLFLKKGAIRATGRPHGALRAVTVNTMEGNLGMRKAERTDLKVSRNARRHVSRMSVRRGRTGQITTLFKGTHNGVHSSPCTSGRSLTVNRYGKIRKG